MTAYDAIKYLIESKAMHTRTIASHVITEASDNWHIDSVERRRLLDLADEHLGTKVRKLVVDREG